MSTFDDMQEFWNSTNEGEPTAWSTEELVKWLRINSSQESSDFSQLSRNVLLERVIHHLDKMYTEYKPKLRCKPFPVNPAELLLWVSSEQQSTVQTSRHSHAPLQRAGPIETEFNDMYNLSERFSNLSMTLPMGKSPQDDLRQDLLIAAKVRSGCSGTGRCAACCIRHCKDG